MTCPNCRLINPPTAAPPWTASGWLTGGPIELPSVPHRPSAAADGRTECGQGVALHGCDLLAQPSLER
jgi:hypothetical protein